MRTRWRILAVLTVVMIATGLATRPVRAWREVRAAERAYAEGNVSEKGLALRWLARLQSRRADETVLGVLAGPDAALRVHAAYAISSTHRMDLAARLQAAWLQETDPPTRSSMIFDWSQLVGLAAAGPFMQAMLASADPWTVLAAARARLRQGDFEAAGRVMALAVSGDAGVRTEAQKELSSLGGSMAGMIGQELPVGDAPAGTWSAEQVAALKGWWNTHVTPRLLCDYLAWRAEKPDSWNKASLLLHAWKSRFGGFLKVSGGDQKRQPGNG